MLACSLVATPAMPPVRARGFCPSISSLRFIVHELGARVRSFLRHMEQKAGSTFSASRTSRSCVSAFSRLVTDHTPTDARCPTCGAATASGPFGLAASAAHFFSTFPVFSQCQAAVAFALKPPWCYDTLLGSPFSQSTPPSVARCLYSRIPYVSPVAWAWLPCRPKGRPAAVDLKVGLRHHRSCPLHYYCSSASTSR
jgi:hypothetical protein